MTAPNVRIRGARSINILSGDAEKPRASDFVSATQNVTAYTVLYHGLRLVLIYKPGFDDTYCPDLDISRITADWLKEVHDSLNGSLSPPLMCAIYKGAQTVTRSDALESMVQCFRRMPVPIYSQTGTMDVDSDSTLPVEHTRET